jgi:hypothetical protein
MTPEGWNNGTIGNVENKFPPNGYAGNNTGIV